MSANKLPSTGKQIVEAVYPDRGFKAYEINSGVQYISQIAQENLVQWSNQALAIGTVGAGTTATYTASLTPVNQFSKQSNLAIPYVTIHVGTPASAANQIYPIMGTTGVDQFTIWAGFDLLRVTDPTNSYFGLTIKNTGAVTRVLYFYNKWQYIQDNSGASS